MDNRKVLNTSRDSWIDAFFPSPRVTFTEHQVFTELYFLSNIYLQRCWGRHPNVARIHNMKMNVTPDFQRYFQNHDEQQREVKQACQQLWRHSRIAKAVCFSTPPHCLYGRPSVNDKNRMYRKKTLSIPLLFFSDWYALKKPRYTCLTHLKLRKLVSYYKP